MPVRKEENTLKTFLMSFDSYEQLPSKLDDIFIGFVKKPRPPEIQQKTILSSKES